MSTLDAFLPSVRPWAPGVPDVTAHKNIRLAAIEFCERTRLWRFEDDYDVTVETCNAGIFVPNGAALHDIEMVMFDGRELLPKATRDVDRLQTGTRWRTNGNIIGSVAGGNQMVVLPPPTSIPKYYTQIDQNSLRVVPAMAGHVYICTRLKPTQDATAIPDFIANEYREVIGWGALGRILTIPGQSYSSPDLGAFYAQKFTEKLDRLSTKGVTGQQNAPKRSRARYF